MASFHRVDLVRVGLRRLHLLPPGRRLAETAFECLLSLRPAERRLHVHDCLDTRAVTPFVYLVHKLAEVTRLELGELELVPACKLRFVEMSPDLVLGVLDGAPDDAVGADARTLLARLVFAV